MKNALVFLPALALSLAACGGNPEGFYSQGQATVSTSTGANYHLFNDATQSYRVAADLPQGTTAGITGSCTYGANGAWNVSLTAVGAPADDLQSISVSIPASNTQSPAGVTARIGTTTFSSIAGGTAPLNCTITGQPDGDQNVRLMVLCNDLTASADPRVVTVSASLTLTECDPAAARE